MVIMQNAFVSAVGLLLGVITLIDLIFEKSKGKKNSDKKTDWFFENKDFDRKLDERADKNQYRNY